MPENVFKGGIFNTKFKDYVRSKNRVILSPVQLDKVCSDLTRAQEEAGFFGSLRHSRELKEKYASTTICPKCGGNLIKRTSRKGQYADKAFLGCCNYPRCRFIKDL